VGWGVFHGFGGLTLTNSIPIRPAKHASATLQRKMPLLIEIGFENEWEESLLTKAALPQRKLTATTRR
jgi:hypothetical protein